MPDAAAEHAKRRDGDADTVQSDHNPRFAETMKQHRVVPVLTLEDPDIAVDLARALAAGGLPLIEITLRTPAALTVVRRLAELPEVVVGAGTVLTPVQGRDAVAAGAKFLVSPGVTPALVDAAEGWGVPYLPGVATAGEAMALAAHGYRVLKFFPAESSGGATALKALAAPLADLVFCPTGGIDAAKAAAYLTLPNVVAVGGSWVAPDRLVKARDWAAITALARAASTIGTPHNEATAEADSAVPSYGVAPSTEWRDTLAQRLQQLAKSRHWAALADFTRGTLRLFTHWTTTPVTSEPAAASETLSQHLRRLNATIEPLSHDAAHFGEVLEHPDFVEARKVLADTQVALSSVMDYAVGNKATLACAALVALRDRSDRSEVRARIADHFGQFGMPQIQTAMPLVQEAGADHLDAVLACTQDWWADNLQVIDLFRAWFAELGSAAPKSAGPRVPKLLPYQQDIVKTFLSRMNHAAADALAADIKGSSSSNDPSNPQNRVLQSVGRYWQDDGEARIVCAPEAWSPQLGEAITALNRTPPRSLLVSGEPLVGKTSFLRLVADRLMADGWKVFEASGADLQAGQVYIGQLEGRLRQLVDEITQDGRTIWYVPDLLQLALSGTHQGQSSSILDQILPAIAEGRLIVFSETTPSSAARLLQLRPRLRRALELIRLEPLDTSSTASLADELMASLTSRANMSFAPDAPGAAVEAAEHYLGVDGLPGAALSLVRLAVTRAQTGSRDRVTKDDVLDTLAQLSGLPLSLLDGSEKLDLAALRAFFAARVIGQPEAVESVVERIAMLKSGLNDPAKPIAVFLFAGPTGTGKTELAKAVADYLFGSTERMLRLDMSEYQQPESLAKIIGGPSLPAEAETLISRIRKQPFSLILLDEFEKSAPPVWDLFLQVFDEGRLTDAYGQTADFRHCLIILTTNLGATRHQSSGLGFAPSRALFTNEQVLAAIGQTFRPEFQNRLDKVIVFQPLTRELMRGIMKKELDRLFERRGLKDRDWAIEWEASALEFLLEKGFSPEMGARPLKRAIDQYVVAPLAQTIVERRFPEGDQFLFMRSDGTALQAEFVDPDDGEAFTRSEPPKTPAGRTPSLAEIILAPAGRDAEKSLLATLTDDIVARLGSPEWEAAKAAVVAAMNAPEFWTRPDRFAELTRYALMDRIAMAADTATSLRARLDRRRNDEERGARELVARLALQLHLLRDGLDDLDTRAPVEVALAVVPALDGNAGESQGATAWCRRILDMYRGWARLRHMQLTELERLSDSLGGVLVISGFGAHRRLSREVGLHVREAGDGAGPRIAARVLLVPVPDGDTPQPRLRTILTDTFASLPRSPQIVRRYRVSPSPLVRNADGTWRSGKLDAVLAGDFDLLPEVDA
jgi:ATP-dependent Clp protease ATP-binding subunit ClpC